MDWLEFALTVIRGVCIFLVGVSYERYRVDSIFTDVLTRYDPYSLRNNRAFMEVANRFFCPYYKRKDDTKC